MIQYTLCEYEIDGARREYTVAEFWDCECEHGYIHRSKVHECPVCGAEHKYQPDARLDEIVRNVPDLTNEELHGLFDALLDKLAEGQHSKAGSLLIDAWLKRE